MQDPIFAINSNYRTKQLCPLPPGLSEQGGQEGYGPQDFDKTLYISGGGAGYAHQITSCPPLPPGFSDLPMALHITNVINTTTSHSAHIMCQNELLIPEALLFECRSLIEID